MTRDEFLKKYRKNYYGKYSVTLMRAEFKNKKIFFAYTRNVKVKDTVMYNDIKDKYCTYSYAKKNKLFIDDSNVVGFLCYQIGCNPLYKIIK